jgi:hypothetical protein
MIAGDGEGLAGFAVVCGARVGNRERQDGV